MTDTIKVPGIKKPLPKTAVLAGAAVTIVAIVVYFRKSTGSAAAAGTGTGGAGGATPGGTAADTSAYPWDGTYGNPGDPYSMDTATGQTYGNEGYTGPRTQYQGNTGPPFSNNAAWSAYALQQLAQDTNLSGTQIAEALGLYLNGQPLTVAQQDIIYSAIGIAGNVPVSGPGGYPPQLRKVKKPGGGHKGPQFAVNPVKGLRAEPGYYAITIRWEAAEHATGYQVILRDLTGHRSGTSATTAHTEFTFRNLTGGHQYEMTVLARPAEHGAKPASVRATPHANIPLTATRR